MAVWPRKAPNEAIDYGLDWNAVLEGKTITLSTWQVLSGSVTLEGPSTSGLVTNVRVLGGIDGESALLLNRLQMSDGEVWEERVHLPVRNE